MNKLQLTLDEAQNKRAEAEHFYNLSRKNASKEAWQHGTVKL